MAESRRRVILATDSLSNGGAERQLVLLAMNLPPEWQAEVWSLDPGVWTQTLREAGIPVMVSERSLRFDARPALNLWRHLRKSRPDVVYAQGWMASVAAAAACTVLRIPLVDSRMRGARLVRSNSHKARLGLRFSDIVVANSAVGLAALRLRAPKGRVIPNGFDWTRVIPRTTQACHQRPLTVVMAARMHEMKNWDLYLAVARLLARRDKGSWKFLAIGDGTDRARLVEDSGDLVADGSLEFIPEVRDVMPLLSSADIGVLLTDPRHAAEGCSNSILEYMAAGLPVLCSDSGGNTELVVDGATGFVMAEEDPESMAQRLSQLASDPDLARRMGESGAQRVRDEFSVEKLVQRTLAAFEDAAEHKRLREGRRTSRGRTGSSCV